jgi:hypothetical protein
VPVPVERNPRPIAAHAEAQRALFCNCGHVADLGSVGERVVETQIRKDRGGLVDILSASRNGGLL